MITASAFLFIKARPPRQELVPKWKTRGPNDQSETPSRQCLEDSWKRPRRQAWNSCFSNGWRNLEAGLPLRPMVAASFIIAAYLCCLGLLSLWGIHRLALLRWFAMPDPTPKHALNRDATILVQLPIYNEPAVVARLIDAVAVMDWPQLRIQVLDDSTDESTAIIAERVQGWRNRGINIQHIRRADRTGFKAGALAHGLQLDAAEFVAVFDADFVPNPAFFTETMGGFHSPNVGMVQARWGHLNRDQNWLTRVEALLLDGHFVVEHTARYRTGRFFNFNGTAGIWRRRAIEEAGGWSHDTVTEDLDLSYRSQLSGWSFVYRESVVVPAELPASMQSFLTQQHRWAKGTAQTARKLALRIVRSPAPPRVRIEAMTHLTMVLAYPVVFGLALLLPLAIAARLDSDASVPLWLDMLALTTTTGSIGVFYAAALRSGGTSLRHRMLEIPAAMALGIGCSVSQSMAVVDGILSNDATFVRTPKQGLRCSPAIHATSGNQLRVVLTGLMAMYYTVALLAVLAAGQWLSLPLLALCWVGFAGVFLSLAGESVRTGATAEMDRQQSASLPGGL